MRTIKTTNKQKKKDKAFWLNEVGKKHAYTMRKKKKKSPFALARLHKRQRRRSMKNKKHTHKKKELEGKHNSCADVINEQEKKKKET